MAKDLPDRGGVTVPSAGMVTRSAQTERNDLDDAALIEAKVLLMRVLDLFEECLGHRPDGERLVATLEARLGEPPQAMSPAFLGALTSRLHPYRRTQFEKEIHALRASGEPGILSKGAPQDPQTSKTVTGREAGETLPDQSQSEESTN